MVQTNTIYEGDALSVLQTLPSECVDMCVTSPPYWGLRNYGVEGQLGLEESFGEYLRRLCDIFDQVRRILKPTGTCWVNLGDTYSTVSGNQGKGGLYGPEPKYASADSAMPLKWKTEFPEKCLCQIPSRFAIEMTARGWILRNEIIWHKPNCMPSPVSDRFTVDFEKLYFFSKNKTYFFKTQYEPHESNPYDLKRMQGGRKVYRGKWSAARVGPWDGTRVQKAFVGGGKAGRIKRAVWSINTRPCAQAHFAVYPPELIWTPVKAGCPVGGVILDPFMGTGTTAEVAIRLSRKYIGIELNSEYILMAQKRINDLEGYAA